MRKEGLVGRRSFFCDSLQYCYTEQIKNRLAIHLGSSTIETGRRCAQMDIESHFIESETETAQSPTRVARATEEKYSALISDANCLMPPLNEHENTSTFGMTDEEKIDFVAAQILEKYKEAFLELAK